MTIVLLILKQGDSNAENIQSSVHQAVVDGVDRVVDEIRMNQEVVEMLSGAGVAIVQVDADHKIIGWSESAEAMFGYSRTEAKLMAVEELMTEEAQPAHERRFSSGLEKRSGHVHVLSCDQAMHKDGSVFSVELMVSSPADSKYGLALIRRL